MSTGMNEISHFNDIEQLTSACMACGLKYRNSWTIIFPISKSVDFKNSLERPISPIVKGDLAITKATNLHAKKCKISSSFRFMDILSNPINLLTKT
jgi:hypothetical protein